MYFYLFFTGTFKGRKIPFVFGNNTKWASNKATDTKSVNKIIIK